MLSVKDLSVRYGDFTALDDLSFEVKEGQWLMLTGPNGAGKSTALAAAAQSVRYSGEVTLLGRNAARMKARERARLLGVLMQNHYVGYNYTVEEVVRLGRYAHRNSKEENDKAVENALELTGLSGLRDQSVLTLSGGELQRSFLAQVLAQDPKVLLLDEPTNHLDLIYQKQIFELIDIWRRRGGRCVVSVVHDLSLARAFGTHALLMSHGRAAAYGKAEEVLTGDALNRVYGMDVGGWMRKLLGQWEE